MRGSLTRQASMGFKMASENLYILNAGTDGNGPCLRRRRAVSAHMTIIFVRQLVAEGLVRRVLRRTCADMFAWINGSMDGCDVRIDVEEKQWNGGNGWVVPHSGGTHS
uniref:Uncharacterized protein n=1 Tax=Ascaris lumbricoides TaxID=6252 RepID=A0A0M3HYM2_ASCLU